MKPSKPSNPLTPAQQKIPKRGPTNPNRPGGIKLGSSSPGGGVLRMPIKKVAQKKKTPSNAPGGMMKPRPPRPPRKDPGPLRKQPMPEPVRTNSTSLTPAKRAEILKLRERINSLQGNPVSPRLKRKRK